MLSRLLACLACLFFASSVIARETVLLDIPQGKLKGLVSRTAQNKQTVYYFHGIPYAKPIDRSTRFKVAEPAVPWPGVYDATLQRSECSTYCVFRDMVIGEDDCLILNVYTPEINKDAKKAVMVWLHGGWFNAGSAERLFYGPDYILDNDVIFVIVQSRLGPFGFISTEDSVAPGNVGLKDQNLALKWIQNNIEYFGGCPRRVTLIGENTGGSAVLYHMASPMSAGLFANAISQSGPLVAPYTINYRPRESAFRFGKLLGIETTDSAELMRELEKKSSPDIVEARRALGRLDYEENFNSDWYAFVPCVESDFGQEIFLSTDPWELIKAGKLADVPLLAGVNLNESLFLKNDLKRANLMNENTHKFLPKDLNITDVGKQKQIGDSIKQYYFGDKPITEDLVLEYAEMLSDIMFISPVQIPLTILSSIRSSPIYNYLFTFAAPEGFFKDILGYYDLENGDGAVHMDQLEYVVHIGLLRSKPEPGSARCKVTHLFTKLFTNFAKTGNPTPTLDDAITVKWEPMGKEGNYAIIDQDLKTGTKLFEERVKFWAAIYKDILGDYAKLF